VKSGERGEEQMSKNASADEEKGSDDGNDDDDTEINPHVHGQIEGDVVISKRQQKRLKRKQHFHDKKETEKKQKTPEVKNISDEPQKESNEELRLARLERRKQQDSSFLETCRNNFQIVIDCGWEDEHNDSALTSLTQQILYCYGCNKKSKNPAWLHLTSVGPRTEKNMKKMKYETWLGISTSTDDYLSNPLFSKEKEEGKKQLVYLTADAEDILEDLDSSEAYIVGGIVDRNRLKGVTYEKAKQQGIRTAKLPIKENISLSATHVLTINHVIEILLKFQETKDWKLTLEQVIPKRKESKGGNEPEDKNQSTVGEQENIT
jgi:tRNA (guanine9-N1)-methyltransferase